MSESRKSSSVWIILAIVFVVLILVAGVGLYFGGRFVGKAIASQRARAEQRRTKLNELEAQRREMQDTLKDSVDSGSVSEGMADRLSKFGKSVGEAAESSSGMEKKGLLIAQRVLQSMAPALAKYEAASKELQEVGFVSPTGLDSRAAIAARVKMVKNFGEANDGLSRILEGMEGQVRQELEKEGVSTTYREQFVKGFLRSANVDLNRTIRTCDTELVTALLKMLAILDRDWGAWTAEGGTFRFKKAATAEEYNKLAASLQDIAARQTAAQQQLVQRTRAAAPISPQGETKTR